jgi:hypothetical protein
MGGRSNRGLVFPHREFVGAGKENDETVSV